MNHVFNKLANDAWVYAPEGEGYNGKIFSKEKFAELIVRECASTASDFVRGPGGDHGIKRAIQEHFGVEE